MKTLYVLRHAKSSWEDFQGNDHDRPLNPQGLEAAPLMGKVLASLSPPPELILTSTAQRAHQTATLVLEVLYQHHEHKIALIDDPQIYSSSTMDLFHRILEFPSGKNTVLLIGHNPVLEELVSLLSSGSVNGNIHMPSAALASIKFENTTWENITVGDGILNMLLFPKLVKNLIK